jgi:cation diffusion facilitator CzcD-associated flavoprotein CzcO
MPYALDYLIVGAGPAGVQLGYYFERQGRDYAILEAGHGPGTFFETYPRHRRLISINKRHTGYDDREVNLRPD